MRSHDTHQIPATDTIEARVAAATTRVEAGIAAGTGQTGEERPARSRLTVSEVGVSVVAGVVVALAIAFVVQLVSGWVTPATDAWELGERVSQTVAADLASDGATRFDLGQLREQDAEWLPQLLLEHGWVGVAGDGCECVYPPDAAVGGSSSSSTAQAVIGTYEVPGGQLTVYADTTARYQPAGS